MKKINCKNRIISLLVLLFAFSGTVKAQIRVTPVKDAKINSVTQGVFYSLPQTYFTFDVNFDVTIKKRGPYYQYAEKYLGLKDVINYDSEQYKIGEVFVSSNQKPDPEQFYFVEFGERAKKEELSILITLNESGLIVGLNELTEIEKSDKKLIEQSDKIDFSEKLFKYFAVDNIYKKTDTVVRTINIDTLVIEKEYYKYSMAEKTLEQKAKEAADFISRIRENRFLLISGYQEVNYGESIEYMDKQLQKLENEYIKLFTGVTMHKSFTRSFSVLPEIEDVGEPIPLLMFSTQNGVSDGKDRFAQNVNVVFESNEITSEISKFAEAKKDAENNLSGYYYRIPEYTDIKIMFNQKVIFKANKMVNQFGVVSRTPSFKSKIEFHQNTGSIKKLLIN